MGRCPMAQPAGQPYPGVARAGQERAHDQYRGPHAAEQILFHRGDRLRGKQGQRIPFPANLRAAVLQNGPEGIHVRQVGHAFDP